MALTKIKTGGITDNAVTDAKVADAITVTGAQTGITQVGTLTAGTWNGTAIASAYLDDDTAHLSTTQTFSGAKTFTANPIIQSDTGTLNFYNASGTQRAFLQLSSTGLIIDTDSFLEFKPNNTRALYIDSSLNSTFAGSVQISHATTPDFTLNDTGGTTNKRVFRISGGGDSVYFEGRNNDNSGDGAAGLIATMSLSDASTTFAGDVDINGGILKLSSSAQTDIYLTATTGTSRTWRILTDNNHGLDFYNDTGSAYALRFDTSNNATFAGTITDTINSSTSYSTSAELTNYSLYLYNSNGSDGTGDNNYASIRFGVGSGAQSVGWLAYQRNGDNSGAFHLNHRYGSSDYKRTHSFGDGELYVMGNISTNRSELVLHTNDGGVMKAGIWMRGGSVSSGVYQSNLFIRNFRHSDNKPWSDATDYDSAIWTHTSSSSYGNLWLGTRGSQAIKIDTSQNTKFYGTASWGTPSTGNQGLKISSGGCPMELYVSTTNTSNFIEFGNPNGGIGAIYGSSSSTTYNTSSDYRLKENEVAISDGLERLNQLKPYRFNFKEDKDTTVDGFFAHEVSSIVPEAITGEKDDVDEDGKIINQMIDHSKLIPLLVSAVQELSAKVKALENA